MTRADASPPPETPAISYARRQLLIDGVPRLVLAGEIHYFRVPRDEWRQRLALAREAGCNAVASYIPWLVHELPDGSIDVTGATDPQRDVGAFIDLCAEEGMWFIARPGPFVMAELKNEGLPYRIYREHPEIIPVGWDARPTPSASVDYLASAFLVECRRWYQAIGPVLADRLITRGGPVILMQLDNEIGMLDWVTNSPALTDGVLADFHEWVRTRHPDQAALHPIDVTDPAAWARAVRSPDEAWAGQLRVDLTEFMRTRFARYVHELRTMAEDAGVIGVPFLVNIHGTEFGSGEPFPIGISQLSESYAGVPGVLSGSDHYLGEMSLSSTTDLYVMNAFMAAVHDVDQPLTSMEFEAGNGDYGGGKDSQYDPHTTELKTRWLLAQGNRLINYYLLAGGTNRHLDELVGDGNDRIAITGERHGTAAPISPEGERGATFDYTRRAIQSARVLEPWLASASEELDALSLGFVRDSFATEYAHPASAVMQRIVTDLRQHRGAGQRRALARSALLLGARFDAVDLQERDPRSVAGRPVTLMLATSEHMSEPVQRRVVEHVRRGGGLLALGPMPRFDLTGRPCSILKDAFGVTTGHIARDRPGTFPSVVAHRWAAPWPETRVSWRQRLTCEHAEVVLTDADGVSCGVDVTLGKGRAIFLAADLPSDPTLFGRALLRLDVHRGLSIESSVPGVFITTTRDDADNRLIHLINTSGYEATVRITLDGTLVGGGDLTVPPYSGHALPWGVAVPGARLIWASAEPTFVSENRLEFGPGVGVEGGGPVVVLETSREVQVDAGEVSGRGAELLGEQAVTVRGARVIRLGPLVP